MFEMPALPLRGTASSSRQDDREDPGRGAQCRRGKVSEEADEVMPPRRKRKKGRRAVQLLQEESEVYIDSVLGTVTLASVGSGWSFI